MFFTQVENLKAIHPDYGNRVQTLLNKYNAEAKKVNAVPILDSMWAACPPNI